MASLSQQIADRLDEAIAAADDPSVALSVVLNKTIRVARLRSDWPAVLWLLMEVRGTKDEQAKDRAGVELAAHFSASELEVLWHAAAAAFISERTLSLQGGVMATSIAEAEVTAAALREQAGHIQPPPGLESGLLVRVAREAAEQRGQLLSAAAESEQVFARVRSRVSDYLAQTEQQIAFGQVSADVWERNRAFVDTELAAIAPDALGQFQAAYRRQAEDDPEARSQALLSCRRVLKSLADALYPAVDEPVIGTDGKPHDLTDDKFINRLVEFISGALSGAAANVLEAELADFGNRLDALNELASKGVHAKVTQADVDVCVIRTYLFVGDLMRLREGTSAALQPMPAAEV
jgi:hypothetical protein